jgi:hypothetical protein
MSILTDISLQMANFLLSPLTVNFTLSQQYRFLFSRVTNKDASSSLMLIQTQLDPV